MKNILLSRFTAAALVALAFTGCSYQVGYNPTYLPSAAMNLGIDGKALVVLSVSEEKREFADNPKSFTASATTLKLPLGEITKQIALKVFAAACKDGADFRNEAGASADYRIVVEPRVARLDYYYNQAKNLGFAITPQVEMELNVSIQRGDGSAVFERTYVSGRTDGDTYAISGSPQEKVNKLIHLTLFKLMTDAALDVQKAIDGRPTG